MALTPTEALALQQEHRLTLRFADDGWYAETRKHTRLHRVGFQTQEEAIEAAIVTINSTVVRDQEADGRRLFDLLKSAS